MAGKLSKEERAELVLMCGKPGRHQALQIDQLLLNLIKIPLEFFLWGASEVNRLLRTFQRQH